jgi:isoleucyl-tRNA synthetase
VYWYILDTLTRLVAPILSFTAEELSDYYQKDKQESIHLQQFVELPFAAPNTREWTALKKVRSALLKAIEALREQGVIKHSLEVHLTIHLEKSVLVSAATLFKDIQHKQSLEAFFEEFIIVSQVTLLSSQGDCKQSEMPGVFVLVQKAQGVKCPRCWQWNLDGHASGLCERCTKIVLAQ